MTQKETVKSGKNYRTLCVAAGKIWENHKRVKRVAKTK
jgi:hypothetical protein